MKRSDPPALRALYIILVPVVLLIILLNTGFLQRVAPAVSIHGKSYAVTQYNYYYFDYYNAFLEENETRLDELGYDPTVRDSAQYYPGSDPQITWKAFFMRQAEKNMAETAYYHDLADAAGYVFSAEELLPVRERLNEHAERQARSGISAANYYISYYGRGMTEAIYTAQLTRQVEAQAYKAYLIQAAEAQAAPVSTSSEPGYRAVDLRVITLDALPDRQTGQLGQAQLDALREKTRRLTERYQSGADFAELQQSFSTCRLGDRDGSLTNAVRSDVPDCLAEVFFTAQGRQSPGMYTAIVDDETGIAYFVILDGFGGSGTELEAAREAASSAVEAEAQARIDEDYGVRYHSFGMRLATA